MLRKLISLLAVVTLVSCTNVKDLNDPTVDLGNFRLGHLVVHVNNPVKGPLSRSATDEEWKNALTQTISERFRRFEGDHYYHLAVSVEGYMLAQPGVPVVASPKSALILYVTVIDDKGGRKLNEKPLQITVLENLNAETIVGSGLTQSREKQLDNLTKNASKLIQNELRKKYLEEKWFTN